VTASGQGPDTTLLVIAKQPVPGRVKTRLVPPFTHEQAAALAEAALADTLSIMLMARARRRVVVLDGEPGPWLPAGFDIVPQCGGTLDERLADAFASVHGPALRPGRRRRILGSRPAGTGSCPAAWRAHVNPEHRRRPAGPAPRGRAACPRHALAARRGHGRGCDGRGSAGTTEPFRRTGPGIRGGPAPGMRRD
jgi:hypothetical protein